VARLAPFGAFVTLEDGIDGLVHISRLGAGRRLKHPGEVLKVGEKLTVTIEKIDLEARRVSLAPVEAAKEAEKAEEPAKVPVSYSDKSSGQGMGTLGDMLKKRLEEKKKGK
jgi:small subunit ribosomal protein S1